MDGLSIMQGVMPRITIKTRGFALFHYELTRDFIGDVWALEGFQ